MMEKDGGNGEQKRGLIWELSGFTSGPVIGWLCNLVLSFPIYKMRAALEYPPSSAVLEGLLILALGAVPRSVSVCFFSQC